MCLTLTCTGENAPDFGFLLHKHPDSIFVRELSFGRVIVFYPETAPTRATVAMLVEVDAIGVVRGRSATIEEYVNDRPYALSSLTSVAMNTAFGSALAGRSKERPELVDTALPLEVFLSAVHSRGGRELIQKVFANSVGRKTISRNCRRGGVTHRVKTRRPALASGSAI